jgi:hypothetical protein
LIDTVIIAFIAGLSYYSRTLLSHPEAWSLELGALIPSRK